MDKINAYEATCSSCEEHGEMHSQHKNDDFSVCCNCGKVTLVTKFDSYAYLKELIRESNGNHKELIDCLEDKLGEIYDNLDWVDLEAMTKLIVDKLADQAMFEVEAENNEANNYASEVNNDYRRDIIGGVND